MPIEELSIKIREEHADSEVTVPADPIVAIAALATLVRVLAESFDVSDKEFLEWLSMLMEEEE